jgi:NodT family efflux transporter outer membrane factor (OMF) lipoprotein
MICFAVSMTGCKIPKLCCPIPGPALPGEYSFNNGQSYYTAPPDALPKASAVKRSTKGGEIGKLESGTDSDDNHKTYVVEGGESDSSGGIMNLIRKVSFLRPAEENQLADEEHTPHVDAQVPESFENPSAVPVDHTIAQNVHPVSIDNASLQQGNDIGSFPIDSPFPQANDAMNTTPPVEVNPGLGTDPSSAKLPVAAFYDDKYLNVLITDALVGNQQLRILAEEIRIANNETYARSGAYLPFVNWGASAGLDKPGRFTRAGAVEDQLEIVPGRGFPEPLGDFMISADVSWEIDIWHRLRNAQRSAAIRYLATQEGRNFVVTRLVADLAENYYKLLGLDARMRVLDATIAIQQKSLEAAVELKAAGRSTELAVQRFRAEVQKNESERTIIRQEIVETENRINFLVGRYPQPVERSQVEFADLNLNVLSSGVPSELLQNRPDIREAERKVAAAGLDVRVARANFYPSLNLTTGVGLNAFSTGYLFKAPESLIYGVAGGLVGPLINRRAIKAEYSSANAAQLQAIYDYQQTILEAHIEVVNHLTKVENLRRSLEVKRRQLDALAQSVDVANSLFQNARAEYIEVLLAQRELQDARQQLVAIKQEQLSAIVNAYQALGGGGY